MELGAIQGRNILLLPVSTLGNVYLQRLSGAQVAARAPAYNVRRTRIAVLGLL
jgi:hypothetical protein